MPSQPITEFQFNKLLEATQKEKNKFVADRDSLMYEIMYYLGLRPMEARCIEISHINFQEKKIFIPANHNKEKQADDIFVPDFLFQKILSYLQEPTKSKWLFPSFWNSYRHTDNPVHKRTAERNFTNRIRTLGFLHISYVDRQEHSRYNLNLYSFRKRFGTFVYKKTKDPKTTANLLRHYDPQLKSVWRYIFTSLKEERKTLILGLYT